MSSKPAYQEVQREGLVWTYLGLSIWLFATAESWGLGQHVFLCTEEHDQNGEATFPPVLCRLVPPRLHQCI